VSRRTWQRSPNKFPPTSGSPGLPGGSPARTPGRRGKRRRSLTVALIVCIVTVSAATARMFIWPDRGMPAYVSAIAMLNGPGDRLDTALRLAWQHRASFVVISRGSPAFGHGNDCAPVIPHVKVICFDPTPATTKGEAEFIGRLARIYKWRSLTLVTVTTQDSRARLRMERCFSGPVYVVTVPPPWYAWPYEVAYESAATVKALIFQPGCYVAGRAEPPRVSPQPGCPPAARKL
jgi:hypothetical protein